MDALDCAYCLSYITVYLLFVVLLNACIYVDSITYFFTYIHLQ